MTRAGVAILALLAAGPAFAKQAPICTDRPAKANATCTVPAGKIQLESSAAGWTLTRAAGVRTEGLALGASVLKFGLTDHSDLQVGLTPYLAVKTRAGEASRRIAGFGDMVVRYKHRLTPAGSRAQVAVIPFVKLPTARDGLGNDKVEGGLALPIGLPLAGPVAMTLGPEIDVLADSDGSGRHVALVNLVNLAAPIAPRLTLGGELWANFNFDPAGTIEQASVDAALAYAASDALQLDIGANLGLTRDTPDLEIYAGASVRF